LKRAMGVAVVVIRAWYLLWGGGVVPLCRSSLTQPPHFAAYIHAVSSVLLLNCMRPSSTVDRLFSCVCVLPFFALSLYYCYYFPCVKLSRAAYNNRKLSSPSSCVHHLLSRSGCSLLLWWLNNGDDGGFTLLLFSLLPSFPSDRESKPRWMGRGTVHHRRREGGGSAHLPHELRSSPTCKAFNTQYLVKHLSHSLPSL
jgi:hypothetical protein